MKKYLLILLALLLVVSVPIGVLATDRVMPRLVDRADLLTDAEEAELLSSLNEISERHRVDVVVVTVNSLDGKNIVAYADDFYDDNGYGYGNDFDGILFLIGMDTREYYISTCGYGITAFTDAGIDHIGDQMIPYLRDGDYTQAFRTYALLCDDFITRAKAGSPYDIGTMPRAPFPLAQNLAISLVIGLAVALIVTGVMKSKLKTIRRQNAANSYVKNDSLNITVSRDRFLYRNVTRRARPKDTDSSGGSSTHRSSSGRSHGGGGGRF